MSDAQLWLDLLPYEADRLFRYLKRRCGCSDEVARSGVEDITGLLKRLLPLSGRKFSSMADVRFFMHRLANVPPQDRASLVMEVLSGGARSEQRADAIHDVVERVLILGRAGRPMVDEVLRAHGAMVRNQERTNRRADDRRVAREQRFGKEVLDRQPDVPAGRSDPRREELVVQAEAWFGAAGRLAAESVVALAEVLDAELVDPIEWFVEDFDRRVKASGLPVCRPTCEDAHLFIDRLFRATGGRLPVRWREAQEQYWCTIVSQCPSLDPGTEHRELVVLRLAGRSYAEIARRTGIRSEAAARQRWHRARQRLKVLDDLYAGRGDAHARCRLELT